MNVNVYRNFITTEQADKLLEIALTNFELDRRTYSGWYARTNRDLSLEFTVKELLGKIVPFDEFHITWINLTEYEKGRELKLHTDGRSEFTFTVPLTDKYEGGEFIIASNRYCLNKGDCIAFDGLNLLHGVAPDTSGYRAALNIWIKKGGKPVI